MMTKIYRIVFLFVLSLLTLLMTGCESLGPIVNNVDEREANEIIVFLASKGIEAEKIQAAETGVGIAGGAIKWNIIVSHKQATEALALLNKNGLPRKKGTNLLELFAKQGLMSSDKEETIRFQAGLAEQLKNTIMKIDGVLDADVQLSFPLEDTTALPGAVPQKITAAVYVKHMGVFEDPNNFLEAKIKRLVSGSVIGLDYDNVAVISDRARLAEITLSPTGELISAREKGKDMVKIWSIVMTRDSLGKFRMLFFILIFLILLFGGLVGFMLLKQYPQWMQKIPLPRKKGEKPPENK